MVSAVGASVMIHGYVPSDVPRFILLYLSGDIAEGPSSDMKGFRAF